MLYNVMLPTADRGIRPAQAALVAEALGFDGFYVHEHTHIPVGSETAYPRISGDEPPDDRYMRSLDPWVSLSMAAAVTTRIMLGTAVALPVEHDPVALAKTIASLDYLSSGRVVLGVGFGWNSEEMADHNVPAGRRRAVLREYLEAMQLLWSHPEASYDGDFVRYRRSWAWPKPVQQPRIPVLLGARGNRRTFAWIAASADGWLTSPGEDSIEQKSAMLRDIWQEAGRCGNPDITVLAGAPELTALSSQPAALDRWHEVGITGALFGIPDLTEEEAIAYLRRLASILGLPSGLAAST